MKKIIFSAGIIAVLSLSIALNGQAQDNKENENGKPEAIGFPTPPPVPAGFFQGHLSELALLSGSMLIDDSLKKGLSEEQKRALEQENKKWQETMKDFHVEMEKWAVQMKEWEKYKDQWDNEIRAAAAITETMNEQQLKDAMEKAEQSMKEAGKAMEEHMASYEVTMKNMEETMKKHESMKKELEEALGTKVKGYKLSQKELIVNGKKQSDELHQRFRKKYLADDSKGSFEFNDED